MKAIRWPGFIAFTLLLTILVAGSWLFAESITKSLAESMLTDLNGAKVDIGSVSINYTPLSIKLNNIQVTDPDKPMTNMLQVGAAGFTISISDLFLKKLIIDDMSVVNIEVDTPRKESGAIKKVSTKEKQISDEKPFLDFDLPDIDLPDIDDLMSKEKLQSEQLVSELDSDLNATQNKWKTIRKDLDNKDRWNDFQSRYNKIKKDFKGNTAQKLAALKDAKALRKDIQLEISKIQQARDQFNEDNKRISRKFKAAKNGPRDDIKRIKEKYNLNNLDTQNITQLIFGEKISEYIHLAEKWYNRIKPYIEESPEEIAEREARKRKQGQNIKFPEYNPKPDFYVRKASIDATIPRGRFIGTIRDISSDQSVNKQPMTLELKGVDMRHRKSESINAEFNYINKNKGYSLFNYDIQALELNEHQISKSNKLPLTMQKGLMSLRLNSRLENKEIKGTGNINFSKVNFTSNNSDKSSFTKMMISSFSNITNFNINTRFSGSFSNLNLRLDSDLDNKLGAQLKNQLKQRGQQFENQLKAKIDQRLKEPMTRLENRKKQLAQIKSSIDSKEKELKQKLADIENRIKNAGKEKTDKKKEELLNKLKSKFKL